MSVVLFCVGAAKAGTSWLHHQFSAHPECHFRSIKELHYFDALDGGRLGKEMRKHRDQQTALLQRLAEAGRLPDEEQARRLRDRADWMDVLERGAEDAPAYLGYMADGAGEARVIGDMTPAYALLSEERLSRMARMAPDVRFLYLMRDPVERLWSHVKMIAVRRDEFDRATADRCGEILDRTISGREDQIARRSDYAATLRRLAGAVPGARTLVEIFEEMVAGEGLARICDFLGISRMTGDPVPVHAGPELGMTREQRRRAADWLAPQYDAAERALGRMPGAWRREG